MTGLIWLSAIPFAAISVVGGIVAWYNLHQEPVEVVREGPCLPLVVASGDDDGEKARLKRAA